MRALPLRLLAVALALIGVVVLAALQQRSLRSEADRWIATGVAGYLSMAVPASPYGDYAADRLVSTVSRVHGSGHWHAGLQVSLGETPVLDDVAPPARAVQVPLPGPGGTNVLGTISVWDSVIAGGLPGASAILAAATFLVAGLAATRRAGWLWPVLGAILVLLVMRSVVRETRQTADQVATTTLDHLGPLAALLLLNPRAPSQALQALGDSLVITELPAGSTEGSPGWRDDSGTRRATIQFTRGSGVVVDLALAPPVAGTDALDFGLAGGGIVLLLSMLPPIGPRRRARLRGGPDAASIPG